MNSSPVGSQWLFAECRNATCKLRFPVEKYLAEDLRCPRCASGMSTVPGQSDDEHQSADLQVKHVHVVALLDNIRSIHNIGSMFRTADGAGLEHLYLCGITATPEHPRLTKTALGAEQTMPWSSHANAVVLAAELHSQGFQLWAIERIAESRRPLDSSAEVPLDAPIVLIVGNEKAGIDPDLLSQCDRVVSLPMLGHKGSLNAAVAFGIAVYAARFGDVAHLDSRSISN